MPPVATSLCSSQTSRQYGHAGWESDGRRALNASRDAHGRDVGGESRHVDVSLSHRRSSGHRHVHALHGRARRRDLEQEEVIESFGSIHPSLRRLDPAVRHSPGWQLDSLTTDPARSVAEGRREETKCLGDRPLPALVQIRFIGTGRAPLELYPYARRVSVPQRCNQRLVRLHYGRQPL
jgi:hypothetical protein